MYYTYIHITLDTNQVFYVGKGKSSRMRAYSKQKSKFLKQHIAETANRIRSKSPEVTNVMEVV